ncbi:hypothetical protein ACH4NS_11990 [Streptomyces mutabilis]
MRRAVRDGMRDAENPSCGCFIFWAVALLVFIWYFGGGPGAK